MARELRVTKAERQCIIGSVPDSKPEGAVDEGDDCQGVIGTYEANPLLKNAVTSIQLGLDDFKSPDRRRTISAVRNLYAGVLLLCKEVLRRLSPKGSNDVLVMRYKKAVKDSNGSIRFGAYTFHGGGGL